MKIYSAYSRRLTKVTTNVGSPEYVEAIVKFSPDGNMFLEYGKTKNRQDEINSYKAACDVNMLVRRYENGDQLALLRDNTGAFADLSNLPRHIHEAQALSNQVNTLYNSMGADIKARYSNVYDFLEAFSTEVKFKDFCDFSQDVLKKRYDAYQSKNKKEVKSDA